MPLHGPAGGKGQLRQLVRLRQYARQCGDQIRRPAPEASPALLQQGPAGGIARQHRHHTAAHGFQQHRRGKAHCRRGRDDGRRAEQIPIGLQGEALRHLDPGRQGKAKLRQRFPPCRAFTQQHQTTTRALGQQDFRQAQHLPDIRRVPGSAQNPGSGLRAGCPVWSEGRKIVRIYRIRQAHDAPLFLIAVFRFCRQPDDQIALLHLAALQQMADKPFTVPGKPVGRQAFRKAGHKGIRKGIPEEQPLLQCGRKQHHIRHKTALPQQTEGLAEPVVPSPRPCPETCPPRPPQDAGSGKGKGPHAAPRAH